MVHYPKQLKNKNNDGRFAVTNVSDLKRMQMVSPVMTQMSIVKTVLIRLSPKLEREFAQCISSQRFWTGKHSEGLSARLCHVEKLPSYLHTHGAFVTIWAPIRSGPSFPHCVPVSPSSVSRSASRDLWLDRPLNNSRV